MDPISIIGLAANGLQIAQLTFDVIHNLAWFYYYVRRAPAHSKELRAGVDTLLDVLKNVEAAFESGTELPRAVQNELNELGGLLSDLNERAKSEKARGLERLKWPFSQRENGEILKKIERFKLNLNISLTSQCG